MNLDCQLLVIGAGPAGAALALAAARSGFAVTLCEQHRITRDKLCGEFLSPEVVPLLHGLGACSALESVPAPPVIDRLRITTPGHKTLDQKLARPGLGLSRKRLDTTLVETVVAAGVEVREQWRAVRVTSARNGGWKVEGIATRGGPETWTTRLVVLATGKGTPPLDAGRGRSSTGGWIAFKMHHAGTITGSTVELHAFPGGYCGVVAVEGGRTNVCGLASRAAFDQAGGSVEGLIRHARRANSALAMRFEGIERPDATVLTESRLGFAYRRPVAGAHLALGDAAALAAPLAGDGVAMALESGALAAPAVMDYLSGQLSREALLRTYEERWTRTFSPRLRTGGILQGLLLSQAGAAAAVGILRRLPWLTTRLIRLTRAPSRRRMNGVDTRS